MTSSPVSDLPELKELLNEINSQIKTLAEKSKTINLVKSLNSLPMNDGVSLLNVKIQTILSYLTNLAYFILLKLNGTQIHNHKVIDSLVQLRVVLEKTRPLEQKIKYQIDKLIKAASASDDVGLIKPETDNVDLVDPLQFKPNPESLMPIRESPLVSKQSSNEETGIYKPPKIAPMHFKHDTRDKSKLTNSVQKLAANSRLLNELRSQYDSKPEIQSTEGTGYAGREVGNKFDDELKAKIEFEEDNFIRPNPTRADKKLLKAVQSRGSMMRFQNDFMDLSSDYNDISGIGRAVEVEEKIRHGQGVLKKKSMNAASFGEKRTYSNVSEMLTKNSSDSNEFRKKVKSAARIKLLQERVASRRKNV